MSHRGFVSEYSKFLDFTNTNNYVNYEVLYSNYETRFGRRQRSPQNVR